MSMNIALILGVTIVFLTSIFTAGKESKQSPKR